MVQKQLQPIIERTNKACHYFPCHQDLEDCVFCYCPYYPCKDETKGSFVKVGHLRVWDCSECTWIHNKAVVDRIFELIRKSGVR